MRPEALNLHSDDGEIDAALVARARAGDRAAWATIVERHWGQAWSLSWAMVRDRSEAESVVQNTFRIVKEKLPDYRGHGPLRAWIQVICRRQALDEMRRRRRLSRELPIACVLPMVRSQEESLITKIDLTRALAALTSDERRAILLTAAGYTSDEMADVLGIAPTTIRSRRARARGKLLRLLDGYAGRAR
jgi:RNA polymerase sigma-70 factor (ECF subfamily)